MEDSHNSSILGTRVKTVNSYLMKLLLVFLNKFLCIIENGPKIHTNIHTDNKAHTEYMFFEFHQHISVILELILINYGKGRMV